MRISVKWGDNHYFANVTPRWVESHDNGAMISCGLTVGQGGFTERMAQGLKRRGQLEHITELRWKHSSCQSSCILRGAKECKW